MLCHEACNMTIMDLVCTIADLDLTESGQSFLVTNELNASQVSRATVVVCMPHQCAAQWMKVIKQVLHAPGQEAIFHEYLFLLTAVSQASQA
eukprot:scaffold150151_cov18-Tisochrysis_lutea.AAC.1